MDVIAALLLYQIVWRTFGGGVEIEQMKHLCLERR